MISSTARVAKQVLTEYKLILLLLLTLVMLWKVGFMSVGNDWKLNATYLYDEKDIKQQSNNIEDDASSASSTWWKTSPLWVEDQKPHINPHKFR